MSCCRKNKDSKGLDDLKKDIEIDEHAIPLEELYTRLNTTAKGLSTTDAKDKLQQDGPNSLTPPKTTPVWLQLVKQLFGGFNLLLWIAAAASFAAYFMEVYDDGWKASLDNVYLGVVLSVVVSISGLFSFFQERKSGNIMQSFANMIPQVAKVMRDGHVADVKVEELVKGDIVDIVGGDKVPADLRIITSRGLKVDNSSLTGESEPQTRKCEFTHKNPLESKNVCLFSTNVLEGSARGVVILTGDNTVVGRIAALTAQVSSGPSPLSKEIDHFINIVSIMAFSIGIIFFIISIIFDPKNPLKSVVFFMGIVVANVPEGIVATVTVCLTLTAVKMRKKNCLVKNLEAVETLGSTSTICSDKTGTLTQNRMTVTHVWVNDKIHDAQRMDPTGKRSGTPIDMKGTYDQLMRCATLCSKSHFRNSNDFSVPIPKRETTGDASEVAIMKYCELVHGDGQVDKKRELAPKICEIPFNSTNKYQVSIHDLPEEGRYVLVMKGAPEKILKVCSKVAVNGETQPKTEEFEADFQKAYMTLGGFGERVLGFCDFDLDPEKYPRGFNFDAENPNFPLKGLRFLGLIAMIDPPRPGVPQAVRLCQSAGIKVVMVTGDHPITAQAIASQVHIIEEGEDVSQLIDDDPNLGDEVYGKGRLRKTNAVVIHGEQLKKISPTTLAQIVENYGQVVFARTSPAQKLQIVEAYQRGGDVVGVTGDGVNDAPALRKADIGIAMGIAGTDVSKQAADMILLNDNFASIVTGIEEGRLIFDNLKKSIAYTLTSNIPEVSPFIAYILAGVPLPMSVVAILMIDLGTDLWPAIALAYEVPESDIMARPPRNAAIDKLVNIRLLCYSYLQIGFMQALSGFTTYFAIMMWHGFLPLKLINIRDRWDNKHVQNVEDSFGQEWGYDQRKALEACCHGAFFFSMVVVQWADVLIAKTRKNSLIQQGMENMVLNAGIVFTCTMGALLTSLPWVDGIMKVTGIRTAATMTAIPWAVLIVLYDELRRWAIRKWPQGWVYKETYF